MKTLLALALIASFAVAADKPAAAAKKDKECKMECCKEGEAAKKECCKEGEKAECHAKGKKAKAAKAPEAKK